MVLRPTRRAHSQHVTRRTDRITRCIPAPCLGHTNLLADLLGLALVSERIFRHSHEHADGKTPTA
jgi:hypothetical protein